MTHNQLHVEFGGSSVAGIKAQNDDAFCAHLPNTSAQRNFKGAVACIADGVSCSNQAQMASQTSVTHFINDYYSTPDSWTVKQAASKVISAINCWLHHHGQQANNRSDTPVTTFSTVIIKSHTAHLLHVGDSRIYLYRDDSLTPLTRDHQHTRGDGQSYLTRALGIDYRLDVDYRQQETQVGDVFALTTDGLHEFVSNTTLKTTLESATQDNAALEPLAQKIVKCALDAGSDDNISCLLVKITDLANEELDEAHQKLLHLRIPPVMAIDNRLDHFRILKNLHSSTRSHVYLAHDEQENKRVIIKAPSENFSDDVQYMEAFRREQWVGRKLDSHHIMKIHPHPTNSAFIYHVCEYIEGQTLRQWIIDNPAPSLEKVRTITTDLVTAIRVLHRNGMVHRDLKPENILLTESMNIKLIDLGTIQVGGLDEIRNVLDNDHFRQDNPVGDINYIAPEYLLGQQGTNRSDIFSLGCIVYEMLSGSLPFDAIRSNRHYPTLFEQWHFKSLNRNNSNTAADLPLWLNQVLQKATAPNPMQRYEALSEFLTDLTNPNADIIRLAKEAPLIQRHPVRFWQTLSLLLFIVCLTQWILLLT